MTSRPARPSWASLAVVAPGSLAFLAAAVMWVSTHDPRAADVPTVAAGPTAAGSTTAGSTTAGSTTAGSSAAGSSAGTSGATGAGDGVSIGLDSIGLDAATSLRLARLQVLLGQAEAQLVLLDRAAGPSVQAPSPVLADAPPPAPAVQPPVAPSPAPVAHATTGASGA